MSIEPDGLNSQSEEVKRSADTLPQPTHTLTWGGRMAHAAQQIALRRMPALGWLQALTPVIERVSALPTPDAGRHRRKEVTPVSRADQLLHKVQAEIEPEEMEDKALSPTVRSRLQDLMGTNLPTMHLHDAPAADELARTQRAAAVTIGPHVYFRQGQFRPQTDSGLALLAHEVTHVQQAMRPSAAWRRATQGGVDEEEQVADLRERSVATHLKATQPQPRSAVVGQSVAQLQLSGAATSRSVAQPQLRMPEQVSLQPVLSSPAAASPALRPMAAPDNRATEVPPVGGPSLNIDELRSNLYRDLLAQIKSDFERGG